ncbi:hypothetical protein [Streptomyces broussonetiae]|uniref:hypothetical protein n=1 Tax=Streptomyces broussonetiae TaxID=2686304 RepID=UPI0018EEDADF|nr:hypothetical protein [Streptomyces broussonetiae]
MWGGDRVDLAEARFAARETRIWAVALWGGTGFVVPDNIDVEVRGLGLFGVFRRRGGRGTARPGAPRVVIRGLALFGAVVAKPWQAGKQHLRDQVSSTVNPPSSQASCLGGPAQGNPYGPSRLLVHTPLSH